MEVRASDGIGRHLCLRGIGDCSRAGSNPASPTRMMIYGRLAQLAEHFVYTEGVRGSSPLPPTICRGSQVGHGECLKNIRFRFDSGPRHIMRASYSGYYVTLPRLRRQFDSARPLHN